MDPVFKKAPDHDTIRTWVEEHDGTPIEMVNPDGERIIDIAFGSESSASEVTPISWDEFFDHLDNHQLVFLYTDELEPEEIKLAYSILTKDEAAEMYNDETELPDPSEFAEENLDNEYVEDTNSESEADYQDL